MIFAVAVAGAAGAVARYLLDVAVTGRTGSSFPWGTLLINVSGSLALGLLAGLGLYHALSATPRTILGTGFLGAYTTFSTFTFETWRLVEAGSRPRALVNVVGSFAAGVAAAALGLALAAW